MQILVTGAAGFIGSHVVDRLLQDGHTVIGVDAFTDFYSPLYKEDNVAEHLKHPNYSLHRADITDAVAMKKVFQQSFDAIIHLAAQAGVRASIENPLLFQKTNVEGSYLLFELAKQNNIQTIIFASSSSVYGNRSNVPFSESDSVDHPISPYAATKKATELIAYTYHHLYNMNCIGLRFFTVYGERGRPDMAPYLFTEAILNDKPIQRFGDGSMQRDFTYINDIVDGVVRCLDKYFGYEIINLGNSSPISVQEFIATIERITGKTANIQQQPERPGDVEKTYADITKAKELLGWAPTTTLENGMRAFISWFKEHRINT